MTHRIEERVEIILFRPCTHSGEKREMALTIDRKRERESERRKINKYLIKCTCSLDKQKNKNHT